MRVSRRLASAAAVAAVMSIPYAAPAVASADYGAIAINPRTGAWGVSHSYSTLSAARRRAERECRGNCRILVWTRNRCGAVVQTRTRFIGGTGRTRKRAFSQANRRARATGANNYRRVAWECSG